MAVRREGTTCSMGSGIVDMTLRFDNAAALSPCPHPQQQLETA